MRECKGWTIHTKGYVWVRVGKGHPCDRNGRGWGPLHLVVFWLTHQRLPLPGHHIHHEDENKHNNNPWNLVEIPNDEHGRGHLPPDRARELGRKGGKATARLRRRLRRQVTG